MIARDFALYDVLNCAATAVDEAESGRPALAEAAWLAAGKAASGLFPSPSPENTAIRVIIEASRPDRGPEGRAGLWNALDAASMAVLAAMDGRRELLGTILPSAHAAARQLTPAWQVAMTVILAQAQRMAAEAGSEVPA